MVGYGPTTKYRNLPTRVSAEVIRLPKCPAQPIELISFAAQQPNEEEMNSTAGSCGGRAHGVLVLVLSAFAVAGGVRHKGTTTQECITTLKINSSHVIFRFDLKIGSRAVAHECGKAERSNPRGGRLPKGRAAVKAEIATRTTSVARQRRHGLYDFTSAYGGDIPTPVPSATL